MQQQCAVTLMVKDKQMCNRDVKGQGQVGVTNLTVSLSE